MAEFSTRSMLDVVVSERSLSDARDKVESEMGRSVRADVDPSVSGRNGRGGRRSVRDIFETQTEVLVQIRDAIEEGNFSSARRGGGGTTILGGLGLGGIAKAGGAAAVGAGGLAIAEEMKNATLDSLKSNNPEAFQRPDEGAGVPAQISTDPLSILQNVDEGLNISGKIQSAFGGIQFETPSWVVDLLEFRITRPDWLTMLTDPNTRQPEWLSSLTNPNITQPEWLSNLTNPRIREPEWVRQLTSVFGGGNGRGGSSGPPSAGARIPNSQSFDVNVNVDGQGLQRDLERGIVRGLQTRDVEQVIVGYIRDQFSGAL